MSISKTVVISCAGMGTRLGLDKPKALVELESRPLIYWQLGMLEEVEDVRVVVGYKAQSVIDTVTAIRPNTSFVFNNDYNSTGTAHSLALGARDAENMVISLDGDLLVHPEDLRALLLSESECVGVAPPSTEEPVYVKLREEEGRILAESFSRQSGDAEWTGLVQLNPDKIEVGYFHVYQLLEPHLPLASIEVRTREIDTPEDYNSAVAWFNQLLAEGVFHG